MHAKIT